MSFREEGRVEKADGRSVSNSCLQLCCRAAYSKDSMNLSTHEEGRRPSESAVRLDCGAKLRCGLEFAGVLTCMVLISSKFYETAYDTSRVSSLFLRKASYVASFCNFSSGLRYNCMIRAGNVYSMICRCRRCSLFI